MTYTVVGTYREFDGSTSRRHFRVMNVYEDEYYGFWEVQGPFQSVESEQSAADCASFLQVNDRRATDIHYEVVP